MWFSRTARSQPQDHSQIILLLSHRLAASWLCAVSTVYVRVWPRPREVLCASVWVFVCVDRCV